MDQKILSKLGGYLLAHREEIIGEWLRAVERNPDISSSEFLKYEELVDHLPNLFENLAGSSNVRTRIHSGARFVTMRESTASIAGVKVTGSKKLYGRRALSGTSYLISGWIGSCGKCQNLVGKLAS